MDTRIVSLGRLINTQLDFKGRFCFFNELVYIVKTDSWANLYSIDGVPIYLSISPDTLDLQVEVIKQNCKLLRLIV